MKFKLYVIILVALFMCGIFIPDYLLKINFNEKFLSPSSMHLLGTDWAGRDMLILILKGLGVSIFMATITSVLSSMLGTFMGIIGSFKQFSKLVEFITDIFLSIPSIIIMILISISLGRGVLGVMLALIFTHWIELSRVVKNEIISIEGFEFIIIAQEEGKSKSWIAINHYLPLVIPQIRISILIGIGHIMLHESTLTFLGFGLGDDTFAIGTILGEGARQIMTGRYWSYSFAAIGIVLVMILIYSLNEKIAKDSKITRRSS